MTEQQYTNANYVIGNILAKAFKPRIHITVSDWSDLNIVLSAKGSSEAGQFRTSRNELLREPMNCFSTHSKVNDVVLCFPVQFGKTTACVNILSYSMVQSPCPIGIFLPNSVVTDAWIDQKFNPILENCKVLSDLILENSTRQTSNRRNFRDFLGGVLFIENASNSVSAKSKTVKLLIVDEIDEFSAQYTSGDDPLEMLKERSITYGVQAKRLYVSTPTVKGVSRIEYLYNQSTQERFHIPCPHCGHWQHLVLEGFNYLANDLENVVYQCKECEGFIYEHQKTELFQKARWIAENPTAKMRGFHANAFYAPIGLGLTWSQIITRYESIKENGSSPEMKTFYNSMLALAYEDLSMQKVRLCGLQDRADSYALRTAPQQVGVITAGVDVQQNRLAVQIVGWGERMRCYVLDYFEIFGNPSNPKIWDELTEILNTPIERADGKLLEIQSTAIDSGFKTNDVYQYTRSKRIRRAMAIKGANTIHADWISKPKTVDVTYRGQSDRFGATVFHVGVHIIKDDIFLRIIEDSDCEPVERAMHFSEDLSPEYFGGVVSETKSHKTGRYVKIKGAPRNEPLDTLVYAFAAARHPELRLHRYKKERWAELTHPITIEHHVDEIAAQINSTKKSFYIPD
jgi:phage terminase large subunit GpA-like protein